MAGLINTVGNYNARGADKVDPRLFAILKRAAERSGRRVDLFSGYRPGSKGQHGSGKATDFRLYDPQGKELANYQDPKTFREYEQFAQDARRAQQELYPDLNDAFRWGGYFWNGGPGNYGNMDLMHLDLGGGNGRGMLAGGWDSGLNAMARKAYPGAESVGMTADDVAQRYGQPTTGPAAGFVPAEADKPEYAAPGGGAAGPVTPGGGVTSAVPNPGWKPPETPGNFTFQMPDLASYFNQPGAAPAQGIVATPQPGPLDPGGASRQQRMIEALMGKLGVA